MKRHIFDLDNTLIYTDLLNNDSYNYALSELDLSPINDCKRITRDVVLKRYPALNNGQKDLIIELKQRYFVNNLNKTTPNISLFKILKVQDAKMCILWTSADKIRVFAMIEYYKISNEFKKIIFSNKLDVMQDIERFCKVLECDSEQLIFYEDNSRVIRDLKQLKLNIIAIGMT